MMFLNSGDISQNVLVQLIHANIVLKYVHRTIKHWISPTPSKYPILVVNISLLIISVSQNACPIDMMLFEA